jgi:Transposase
LSLLVMGALFYVGIDWATASHAVCVLDDTGRRVAAFSIEHSAAGFTNLVRRPMWTG